MWTFDPATGQFTFVPLNPTPPTTPPAGQPPGLPPGQGGTCISIWEAPPIANQPGHVCYTACGSEAPYPGSIHLADTTFPPDPAQWGVIDKCQGSGETTPPTDGPPQPPPPIGEPPPQEVCCQDSQGNQQFLPAGSVCPEGWTECFSGSAPSQTCDKCGCSCCQCNNPPFSGSAPSSKWILWQGQDTCQYCLPDSSPPNDTQDQFIDVYDDAGTCQQNIADCQPPEQPPPEPQPEEPPPEPLQPPPQQIQNQQDEDWCMKLMGLRQWCIDIGNILLQAYNDNPERPGLPKDLVFDIYKYFGNDIKDVENLISGWNPPLWSILQILNTDNGTTYKAMNDWLTTSPMSDIINGYAKATADFLGYDSTEMRALLAVRSLVFYALSASIKPGNSWENNESLTTGVKIGGGIGGGLNLVVVDVGMKLGAEGNVGGLLKDGHTVIGAAELKPALIPLVNLLDYFINATCPNTIPNLQECIGLYKFNTITKEVFHCLIGLNGYVQQYADFLAYASSEKLTADEVVEWCKRVADDPDDIDEILKTTLNAIGIMEQGFIDAKKLLYDELPNTTDVLGWTTRNTFDLDIVEKNRLAENWDTKENVQAYINELRQKAGNVQGTPTYQAIFGKLLRQMGISKFRNFNDYCRHWIIPHVEQLSHWLWRLRPENAQQIVIDETGLQPNQWGEDERQRYNDLAFTSDDFLRYLREQDYQPGARPRALAIAYQPLQIRYLRIIFNSGGINQDQLGSYLQDIGYSPKMAKIIAQGLELERRRLRAQEGHGLTMAKIVDYYREGFMTEQEATDNIKYFGFTNDEAARILQTAQVDFLFTINREKIRVAGECFVSGRIGEDEAKQALASVGVQPERVDGYISLWQAKKYCSAHRLSESMLVTDYKSNIITNDQLLQHLLNLNYTEWDASVILAKAIYDKNKAYEKEVLTEIKKQEQEQERLARNIHQQLLAQQRKKKAFDKLELDYVKALERAKLTEDVQSLRGSEGLDLADASSKVEKAEIRQTFGGEIASEKAVTNVEIAKHRL